MNLNVIEASLKVVFKNGKYVMLCIAFALFIFLFNILIFNYSILISNFSWPLLFAFVTGAYSMFGISSLISIAVISILSGIVISMSIFVIRRQIQYNAGLGSSGIILSIIAPSCSACALGVFSILGLGGIISILPFQGLEIKYLALALLFISIWYLAKKIATKTCKLSKNDTQKN